MLNLSAELGTCGFSNYSQNKNAILIISHKVILTGDRPVVAYFFNWQPSNFLTLIEEPQPQLCLS